LSFTVDGNIATIALGLLTLIGTIVVALLGREQEHRLTKVEEAQADMVTKEEFERRSLSEDQLKSFDEICFMVKLMWKTYEQNIPTMLKNPEEMDDLLDRASKGIDEVKKYFTSEEKTKLITFLEEQTHSKDGGRRLMATIYLDMLKFQHKGISNDGIPI